MLLNSAYQMFISGVLPPHHRIEDLISTRKTIKWQPKDLIVMYRHMARYQITGREGVSVSLDKLERDLGISDKSTWYKDLIL